MSSQQPTCVTADGVGVIAYPNGTCPPGSSPIPITQTTNGGGGDTGVLGAMSYLWPLLLIGGLIYFSGKKNQ
jgi:hypothetical protein